MPEATSQEKTHRRRKAKKINPVKVVRGYELNNLAKKVKKMIPKAELKYDDTTQASTTITSTATIVNLFNPAQGDTAVTHTGDQAQLKSMFLRLSILPNATAGVNFLRIIVVRDKQPNGAVPTAANILEAPTDYLSPIEGGSFERFKVVFDRTYTVDGDANGAQVDKIYRKLNSKVRFVETIGQVNTNGMFMLQLSDQAVNGPTVSFYSRVRFTDV